MTDFSELRERMVREQIESRGITNSRLLAALRSVPREQFVAPENRALAYDDHPLPIEAGQTISQPYIVAVMIDAAAISERSIVLEIGAGSGYAVAVLGRIARLVVGVERQHELVLLARERIHRLGLSNVLIVEGDGSRGWPAEAPYDAILAAASGSHVPQPLLDQLTPGGRLVMPVGDPAFVQKLVKLTKRPGGSIEREELGAVRFVPLIGEEGWSEH